MNSHPQLLRLFRRFNKRYFADKLPEPLIHYAHITTMRCFGTCEKIGDEFFIIIDPQWASTRSCQHLTVLHEMVHIHLWPHDGHGKKFQNEMRRLANAGAFKEIW